MKKLHVLFFAVFGLNIFLSVQAEEQRYVSDDLSTYVYKGPGDHYRIAGILKAGEPVMLLNTYRNSQYAQVRNKKGQVVWILTNQLSEIPSQRLRIPELEEKIKTLHDQLSEAQHRLQGHRQELQEKAQASEKFIEDLKTENTQLKNQVAIANNKVNEFENHLQIQKNTIMMKWFIYGGSVAGGGLILGLLLPYFIPRRKKNYGWLD